MEMEVPPHRTWMYNRLHPGRKGHVSEFLNGVNEFIEFACQQKKYLNEGVIRCPCKLCKNESTSSQMKQTITFFTKDLHPDIGFGHAMERESPISMMAKMMI